MKTRKQAIIGMIAGLTAVCIFIAGCDTGETPDISSSSSVIQESDNTSESVIESDDSVPGGTTETSLILQVWESELLSAACRQNRIRCFDRCFQILNYWSLVLFVLLKKARHSRIYLHYLYLCSSPDQIHLPAR